LGITDIEALLGYLTPAAPETATEIIIPAGAEVEIAQALPTVRSLVVEGRVRAPSVGDGTNPVAVTVRSDAILAVTTDIKFDTGSTIEKGAKFSGHPTTDSAAALAIQPGSTINGTFVKDDDKVVAVISAAGLTGSLEAGKTYQIVGKVETAAVVSLTAGVTLLIPDGAELVAGAGIGGQGGTVIVEGTGKATGMPKLSTDNIVSTSTSANPASLDVTVSSTKNLANGNITIKLKGTVTGGIPTGDIATSLWGLTADSTYSWVVLDNLLPAPVAGEIQIKQTNDSFRLYTGTTLEDSALITEAKDSAPYIYIPSTDTPFKWKKNTINAELGGQPADTANNGFGVLLSSVAEPKTATIAIDRPTATPVSYTVIVDWSGVKIN
jgi:hypothetical protein